MLMMVHAALLGIFLTGEENLLAEENLDIGESRTLPFAFTATGSISRKLASACAFRTLFLFHLPPTAGAGCRRSHASCTVTFGGQ